MAQNPLGEALPASQAAAYLGISRVTLGRLVAAGRVTCHQRGPKCHRQFFTRELDAYVASTRVTVPAAPRVEVPRPVTYGRNVDHLIGAREFE